VPVNNLTASHSSSSDSEGGGFLLTSINLKDNTATAVFERLMVVDAHRVDLVYVCGGPLCHTTACLASRFLAFCHLFSTT
jgi:hypothetical protein